LLKAAELTAFAGFTPHIYVQLIFAVFCSILVGRPWPNISGALKPLGNAFIKPVKMAIAPMIFFTIVSGIAGMNELRNLGRAAAKAFARRAAAFYPPAEKQKTLAAGLYFCANNEI